MIVSLLTRVSPRKLAWNRLNKTSSHHAPVSSMKLSSLGGPMGNPLIKVLNQFDAHRKVRRSCASECKDELVLLYQLQLPG